VPEEEVFCRTIPADAKSVHVLVPSHLSADDALQHLRQLADERRLTHRTWCVSLASAARLRSRAACCVPTKLRAAC
jgi:hypothetical protein